jgi:hypothetical protein
MTDEEKPVPPSGNALPNGAGAPERPRPEQPAPEAVSASLETQASETRFEEAAYAEPTTPVDRRRTPRGPRPETLESREPLVRESGGYQLRLEPKDLARLRELPGSKGKSDRELGESFLDGQASRLTASLAGDVEPPAEVRVVVDPYSRQAFLAVGRTIRSIVSF